MKYFLVFSSCLSTFFLLVLSQKENEYKIGDSANNFAVNLLRTTTQEAGNSLNIALSPYTVWTLLSILNEGAKGNTEAELSSALMIPKNRDYFRNDFRNMSKYLSKPNDGVTLEISNAIFTDNNQRLKPKFQETAKNTYNVNVIPVNFQNVRSTTDQINNYIAKATNNRIQNLINPSDIREAQIFLTSTLYFNGKWKTPFNNTATKKADFFDEKNNKIGDVDMMYQTGFFPYSRVDFLNSHVVELPYGNDEKVSMLVILPFKGENVLNVLNLLSKAGIKSVFEMLDDAQQQFFGEDVLVYLPKFKVSSDLNLNIVLDKLGIKDLFNEDNANLLGMFYHYLYVSRLVQKAEIEVTEEGTVASAVAAATVEYKSPAPKFIANRPFLYFIINKEVRTVIFAGKITNPNTIK